VPRQDSLAQAPGPSSACTAPPTSTSYRAMPAPPSPTGHQRTGSVEAAGPSGAITCGVPGGARSTVKEAVLRCWPQLQMPRQVHVTTVRMSTRTV